MVVAGIGRELAIIAAEGKAEESFAKIVSVWNDSAGKQQCLDHLCNTLRRQVRCVTNFFIKPRLHSTMLSVTVPGTQ